MIGLGFTMAAAPGFANAFFVVIYFLVDWGYGIFLETVWSGQTVGKRVMSLRVIQESGVRIGFYHAALRNLRPPGGSAADAVPGGRGRRARLGLAPAAGGHARGHHRRARAPAEGALRAGHHAARRGCWPIPLSSPG